MVNPILQMINSRSSVNGIGSLLQMLNGNPQAMYNNLMNSNPQFAQFVRENQGKSPDQIAREHGIDPGILKNFMK